MAQTQFTIPQTALSVGRFGPVTSGVLPQAVTEFVVNLAKIVWPAAGSGHVMTLTVEESPDGGASWFFSASDTWDGGLTPAKGGGTLASDWWITTLMFEGTNRKLRLTLDVAQACTVSGSVAVQ